MSLSMQVQKYEVIVIGGGVNGLSTAYQLAKKQIKVAILQRYALGHNNGSSHSPTRLFRTVYQNKFYHDLANLALKQSWPQIEKQLKQKFIHKNNFIYFDETQNYEDFASIARADSQQNQYFTTYEQLKKAYPNFPSIKNINDPIVDRNSGVIAAENYMRALQEALRQMPNVTIFEHTLVKNLLSNEKNVTVQTEEQSISASKVVVACGRWLKELVPDLHKLVKPVTQMVAFIEMTQPKNYKIGKYPCWSHSDKNGIFYCLPDIKGNLLKIAQSNKENQLETKADKEAAIYRLNDRISQYFGKTVKQIKRYEQCFFVNTKSEDFIIDWSDDEERILVVSACSGHGFKFGPLVGRIAAQFCQQDESTIGIVQKNRHYFRIPYHQGIFLQE